MQQNPVKSSMIGSIGYDPAVQVLEVVFLSGDTYQYAFVPPEVYAEMAALTEEQSIGKFFHEKIKLIYRHREVTAERNA